MILSHDHRLIFLKTGKTAGTSLELALSQICGPLDIITPITLEEEQTLRVGRGPQNYIRKGGPLRRLRGDGIPRPDRDFDFYNHIRAEKVREYVGPKIWRNYFKVGFVRNPWDRIVSGFHWRYRKLQNKGAADFKRYLQEREWEDWGGILRIDGTMAVDFVGRYENLHTDFRWVLEQIGARDEVELPTAKAGIRPSTAKDYRMFYDEESRDIVAKHAAQEIAEFGYIF